MGFNIENDHNPDKVVVYGTMIVFPGYKQVVGRVDVIHNGKKYTLVDKEILDTLVDKDTTALF